VPDLDVETVVPNMQAGDRPQRLVLILADDLIWSTRLAGAVAAAGATAAGLRGLAQLEAQLAGVGDVERFVIVDLTARAYDGVEAVRVAANHGARVIAVGQHDDPVLRRAAIAAGAQRVYSYRALFEKGPAAIGAWLGR
jgi:DNA-binding NarL/FixJ family response regulator